MQPRMSYLQGFTAADFYQAQGAFGGSLPAGFMAAALFRVAQPNGPGDDSQDETSGDIQRVVCSNLQQTGVNTTRGWAISVANPAGGDVSAGASVVRLTFVYGGVAEAIVVVEHEMPVGFMLSLNTLLVQVFFGVESTAGNQLFIAVNGNLINPAGTVIAGYSPPDAASFFRIGQGILDFGAGPETLVAHSVALSGFSYFDGVPSDPASDQPVQDVVNFVTAYWNQVQEAEDMVPDAGGDITDLFSVRRRLVTPIPSWQNFIGNTDLDRVGAAALSTLNGDPRFSDDYWAAPPV